MLELMPHFFACRISMVKYTAEDKLQANKRYLHRNESSHEIAKSRTYNKINLEVTLMIKIIRGANKKITFAEDLVKFISDF